MKKRLYLGVTFLAFFCISAFSLIAYAEEKTRDLPYGDTGITLTCYIKCTNSYGEGSTAGGQTDGWRNYVKVATYDKNGNMLGWKEAYTKLVEIRRVSTNNTSSTRTFHAVAESDDDKWDTSDQLFPIYQQCQLSAGSKQ